MAYDFIPYAVIFFAILSGYLIRYARDLRVEEAKQDAELEYRYAVMRENQRNAVSSFTRLFS